MRSIHVNAMLAVTVLFAIGLAAGCPAGGAGDDDDDGGEEGEGEGGDPAEALADAAIDYLNRCGIGFTDPDSFGAQAEPILFESLFGDIEEAFRAQLLAQFASDAVTIDAGAVAACIAAIDAAPCDDDDPGEIDACDQAITGTLAEGDACAFDTECSDGLSCFVAADAADDCGSCEPESAEGESCVNRDCADDLDCIDNICAPEQGGGGQALFEVGDACDPDGDECELFDTGLACVDNGAGGNECVPAVIVQVGETCDTGTRQRYCENSASVSFCVDDGTGVGECTDRPGPGEECLLTLLCDQTIAVCDQGTCEAGGAAGDGCDADNPFSCQVGLQCGDDATCAPFLTLDDPPTCN